MLPSEFHSSYQHDIGQVTVSEQIHQNEMRIEPLPSRIYTPSSSSSTTTTTTTTTITTTTTATAAAAAAATAPHHSTFHVWEPDHVDVTLNMERDGGAGIALVSI